MEARYVFEHQFIPDLLFSKDEGLLFLMALTRGGGDYLLRSFRQLWKGEEADFPYTEKDYSVHPLLHRGEGDRPDLRVIAVRMPPPERFPDCSAVFICLDEKLENIRYFTKELSIDGSFMLCGWSAGGVHSNHGTAPDGLDDLLEKISRIYYRRMQKPSSPAEEGRG